MDKGKGIDKAFADRIFDRLQPGRQLWSKNLCFQWAHQRSLISFDKLDVGKRLQIENKKGENTLPASKAGGPKTLNAANNNGDIAIEFVSG